MPATRRIPRLFRRKLYQPFPCLSCGEILGEALPESLKMGTGIVEGPIVIRCSICGAKRRWHPSPIREGPP